MEQEHSPSEHLSPDQALLHARELLQGMKGSTPAQEPTVQEQNQNVTLIREVTKILAQVILDLNSSPPRQPIRAVVDNTASESGDKTCSNGCSGSADVTAPSQALPSARPLSVTPLPTTINAGSKLALVIENDKSLLTVIKKLLKEEGYVVRSARDRAEGLSLYSLCAPFDVVLIDYYVPQTNGAVINCFAPQKDGIELAIAIREINPSQRMVIAAFDYEHPDQVPRPRELMQIPVLVSPLQLRKLLEKLQYSATREEIEQAIATLSPVEWLKLQKSAACRAWGLGRSAGDKGKDLLQEALLSTFVGVQGNDSGRRWNKRVDFVKHLTEAMRGISSHWRHKFDEREVPECEAIKCDAEGQELSPLDNLGLGDSPDERLRVAVAEGFQPAAERQLIAKEEIERIFRMFKDDKEVTLVLEGWSKGMKKNEITQKYELTAKQYDAATKRIRAKLLGRRNGRNGGGEHGR
jgi:CheY-like chemotaxis protein